MATAPDEALTAMLMIGASTGGPRALTQLLAELPLFPGVACCIVQHMPAGFTANLAKRLNDASAWSVEEGRDGERVQPAHVYVAPGGLQMKLSSQADGYRLLIDKTEPVNGHRPSVDVLFQSAVTHAAERLCLVGVLLTGMGRDGARGLAAIHQQGGYTLAESAQTAVVYGMPRAAVQLGAVTESVPLYEIADRLQAYLMRGNRL